MSKFKVAYPSGAIEITEQSDCYTLDQFVNAKFGSSDYAANGVIVEHMGMEENAVVNALMDSVEFGSDVPFISPQLDEQKAQKLSGTEFGPMTKALMGKK